MNIAELLKRIGLWTWIVTRFVLFGLTGFWAIIYGSCMFMERVFFGHIQYTISPLIALPLIFIGAIMMLYGTGEWKRPAYLWVFLSIPISLFLSLLLPESIGDKGTPGIAIAVAAFSTNALVRAYYKRRAQPEKQNAIKEGA